MVSFSNKDIGYWQKIFLFAIVFGAISIFAFIPILSFPLNEVGTGLPETLIKRSIAEQIFIEFLS